MMKKSKSSDDDFMGQFKARTEERSSDVNEIKREVNNLIWMHAPENLTLAEAEKRACDILDLIFRPAPGR